MQSRIPLPPRTDFRITTPDTKPSGLLLDAGLLLGGWLMRAGVDYIKSTAVDAYTTTLTVSSDDMAYTWVSGWLATLPEFKRSRRLEVTSRWSRTHNRTRAMSAEALEMTYGPAIGSHLFRYNGVPVVLKRSQENVNHGFMSQQVDKLSFRFVKPDPQIARDLMNDAVTFGLTRDESTVPIYHNSGGHWNFASFKRKRPQDSVFLAPGQWDEMVGVLDNFFEGEEWYRRASIPYRSSMMLEGPPGTGKSTTALALASYFDCPVYYLNLLSEGLTDDNISGLMSSVPWGALVLIEDGDALFDSKRQVRTDELGKKQTNVSFTGFLNALDGLLGSEGYALLFTTNHPERLDTALTRKGRMDHRFHIGYACTDQIRDYLIRMARDRANLGDIQKFADSIGNNKVPMSSIQGALIDSHGDVDKAMKDFRIPDSAEEALLQAAIAGAAPPPKKEDPKAPAGEPAANPPAGAPK